MSSKSDSSRTQLALVKEATPGVTPTNPQFKILRVRPPVSFGQNPNFTKFRATFCRQK